VRDRRPFYAGPIRAGDATRNHCHYFSNAKLSLTICHCFGYVTHLKGVGCPVRNAHWFRMLQAELSRRAHRPRAERDLERARRAAEAARSGSRPALAAALAQIGAAFDEAATINGFKIKVERLIRLGPDHPAVRSRFAARAAMLHGRSLDTAIVTIERWRWDEQRAFAIASAFGRGSRLSLQVLDEIRLLLRWLRFKRLRAEYAAALAALRGDAPALEAAE
jgi:hypothetical protein